MREIALKDSNLTCYVQSTCFIGEEHRGTQHHDKYLMASVVWFNYDDKTDYIDGPYINKLINEATGRKWRYRRTYHAGNGHMEVVLTCQL